MKYVFNFSKNEIKEILINYYKNLYDNPTIDIDVLGGINNPIVKVTLKYDLIINEIFKTQIIQELNKKMIIKVFNETLKDRGYNTKDIIFETETKSNGYNFISTVKNIKI